ncbi:MAG: GNAT family N-acetyltransferase [bacterium]
MSLNYRGLKISDYHHIISLWEKTPGIGLSTADSRVNIESFLERNPGLSFVCEDENKIIGTILAGNDGRRGYIYHLAVDKEYRKSGIARTLVLQSMEQLSRIGIEKCHLFVLKNNDLGKGFWESIGWEKRKDIVAFSKNI